MDKIYCINNSEWRVWMTWKQRTSLLVVSIISLLPSDKRIHREHRYCYWHITVYSFDKFSTKLLYYFKMQHLILSITGTLFFLNCFFAIVYENSWIFTLSRIFTKLTIYRSLRLGSDKLLYIYNMRSYNNCVVFDYLFSFFFNF